MDSFIQLLKDMSPLIAEFCLQMIIFLIYMARSEERMKARLDALEKENKGFLLEIEEIHKIKAMEKDLVEFKARQKDHDLTLWSKIDGIKADIQTLLQSFARVEAKQEIYGKGHK